MHHKKIPRSTRPRVLMVAKVVTPLIRDQSLQFKRELLSGVSNPLDSFLLSHKEVGKSNEVKAKKAIKVQAKEE